MNERRYNEGLLLRRIMEKTARILFPGNIITLTGGDVPEMFESFNTQVKLIDSGMTPLFQFIDAHVK